MTPSLAETVKRIRERHDWADALRPTWGSRFGFEQKRVSEEAHDDRGVLLAELERVTGERDTSSANYVALLEKFDALERERDEAKAALKFKDETNKALQDHMRKTRTPGTLEVCERWRSNNCSDYPQSDFDVSLCHVVNCPRKRAHSPAAQEAT